VNFVKWNNYGGTNYNGGGNKRKFNLSCRAYVLQNHHAKTGINTRYSSMTMDGTKDKTSVERPLPEPPLSIFKSIIFTSYNKHV